MSSRTVKIVVVGFIAFHLAGCGASQKRKEAIAELNRIQVSTHGLDILVTAGLTKQEYSQRFGDVLLKVGDLDSSAKTTLPKLRKNDQATVKDVYADLFQSLEAYREAKDYFGAKVGGTKCREGWELECNFFLQAEYDRVKAQFPLLDLNPVDAEVLNAMNFQGIVYSRSDMVQALWTLARQKNTAAGELIQGFEQK